MTEAAVVPATPVTVIAPLVTFDRPTPAAAVKTAVFDVVSAIVTTVPPATEMVPVVVGPLRLETAATVFTFTAVVPAAVMVVARAAVSKLTSLIVSEVSPERPSVLEAVLAVMPSAELTTKFDTFETVVLRTAVGLETLPVPKSVNVRVSFQAPAGAEILSPAVKVAPVPLYVPKMLPLLPRAAVAKAPVPAASTPVVSRRMLVSANAHDINGL